MAASWMTYTTPEAHTSSEGPDYFRDSYPYVLPPLVQFERQPVKLDPASEIWVTDTTFRDGQQSRAPYTVEQIGRLYEMLHRLGGPKGMVRQSEFFLYTKKDREAVERCQAFGFAFPQVTGWIRATMGDYQLVRAAGLKETGILCSISDYHIFKKLNSTREEVVAGYLEVVDAAGLFRHPWNDGSAASRGAPRRRESQARRDADDSDYGRPSRDRACHWPRSGNHRQRPCH